jgi:hypothetical protein
LPAGGLHDTYNVLSFLMIDSIICTAILVWSPRLNLEEILKTFTRVSTMVKFSVVVLPELFVK